MISSSQLAIIIVSPKKEPDWPSLIFIFLRAIYSLHTHPLRKYPGPLLNKLTYIVKAYYLLRGDYVFYLQTLHRKYGHTVCVSPTELCYIDSQAWTEIYGHPTTSKSGNLPKDSRKLRFEENGAANILSANDADHRRIRRIQTHMFSEKALTAQEPLIMSYVDLLISHLQDKANHSSTSVVNLVDWFNYTTFDILGKLTFGESFDCLQSKALHPWINNIFLFIKDSLYWAACDDFPWPLDKLLYRLTPSETRDAPFQATDFANQKARARMARDSSELVDFMSYIMKHNDEKGMTKPEIENNAQFLILAGSETISSFLSGLTFHLLTYPQHLVKLTSLIRDTFITSSEITGPALDQLEYFNVIIEESFRLYPPVTIITPRYTPTGDRVICGEVVPEHISISVSIIAANTSPDLWTDPDDFVPERWYKDDRCPEKYRSDERKVMQPFSIGPRNCIGQNMAKHEIRLILAAILWNFNLELQPESLDWKKSQKVFGLWERPALKVRLIPRDYIG
ncbi:Bgt-1532 [Blumeria graminis f. sp. tritici]|uniref:Bgt-1532 n=2 Tax=Blumeria graminis f. sp. tritici TaxID=62690 RepID=A0A061HNG4_BLUGR|nr:N-formyltyrosine oxidase [Blumeria graminis f. sp. tritici 96224]VCU39358.1 Bgt-1532 [Blumeria graminis f. sp. tritici]